MKSRAAIFIIGMGILISSSQLSTAQWEQTGGPPGSGDIMSFAVSGSYIFAGIMSEGVFRSADNGATWRPINVGLRLISSIFDLVATEKYLFAGTLKGVWRLPLSNLSIEK